MRKKENILLLAAIIIGLIVFLLATGKLIKIHLEYQKGNDTYEELMEYVKEPEAEKDESSSDADEAVSQNPYLKVDFEGLKAVNPDVIAWIHIPALDISYPVVQGTDNSYYLHHLFSGEYNINGSIFVDYHNTSDFTDSNTIVYGHNMKNGSMFGTLGKYQDKALFDQNPCFYIYLPDQILKYRIFSCYAGNVGSIGYTYRFPEVSHFSEFLDVVLSYSGYNTETEVFPTDKVVTLSTCVNTNRDYRYLVHGKLDLVIGGRNPN